MAKEVKGPLKKSGVVEKKVFNLSDFKKKFNLNHSVKDQDLTWIPLSKSYHEALGIPGFARGYVQIVRGYSNTGKSTAIYEGVAGAQKIGDFPVIIETEGNWNWEHARNIGVKFTEVVDEATGEIVDYEGDFLLFKGGDLLREYGKYDYSTSKEGTKFLRTEPVIEDVSRLIDDLLEAQINGDFPRNIAFFWDSIGTLNCFKSVMSKSSNNQWNAGAMESAFKAILNFKIPDSRREGKEFVNTFVAVQKIWLDNENKVIKHKGGEAVFFASRLIIHFGGILTHSTTKLSATSLGKEYQFGVETRVRCEKNHVNGIEQKGKLASTPHGYWNPAELDDYKKQHKDFINEKLGVGYEDFEFVRENVRMDKGDLGE